MHTLVPMRRGDFIRAQAVKWDFVSSTVMAPLPLYSESGTVRLPFVTRTSQKTYTSNISISLCP